MTKPLSPTQLQILTSAAEHPARRADAPLNLPAAARNAVFQSMLRAGLLEEVTAAEGTARAGGQRRASGRRRVAGPRGAR
jgi:hypothetical protein